MIWASSWQHLPHPVPPWWALTLPVLFANLHPVDLCPRNSSLDALVFSYLLVFSRIPCGSHLLLLLRAFCVCSCCTPSAFTACLPSEGAAVGTPESRSISKHLILAQCFPQMFHLRAAITAPLSLLIICPGSGPWLKAGAQPERCLYLCSFRSWWIHASCSEVTGTVWNGRRQHW